MLAMAMHGCDVAVLAPVGVDVASAGAHRANLYDESRTLVDGVLDEPMEHGGEVDSGPHTLGECFERVVCVSLPPHLAADEQLGAEAEMVDARDAPEVDHVENEAEMDDVEGRARR